MKKNIKIISAEQVVTDGQLCLHYTIESNGKIKEFERPFYDKNGNIDPEVLNILSLSKKHNEECGKILEEELQEETKKTGEEGKSIEPVNKLTVYKKPEQNAKIDRNYKGMIATGLSGLLLGIVIATIFKGCGASKVSNNTDEDIVINDHHSIVQENQTKLTYISKDTYVNSVQELCEYLNKTLGFNYKPQDLNAFYYVANIDKFTQSSFSELVSEGYLADTDVAIIQSTANITSDLKTKFSQTGSINIDFSKIFYDDEVVAICDDYSTEFNKITSTELAKRPEVAQTVLDKLETFMFLEPEKGYNTMPVGSEFIFNRIIADTITIKSGECGVETSQAVTSEINNITDVVKQLEGNFNCITANEIIENQKIK